MPLEEQRALNLCGHDRVPSIAPLGNQLPPLYQCGDLVLS